MRQLIVKYILNPIIMGAVHLKMKLLKIEYIDEGIYEGEFYIFPASQVTRTYTDQTYH